MHSQPPFLANPTGLRLPCGQLVFLPLASHPESLWNFKTQGRSGVGQAVLPGAKDLARRQGSDHAESLSVLYWQVLTVRDEVTPSSGEGAALLLPVKATDATSSDAPPAA